nr:IS1634 family transposase [Brevibacterium jeotgali]
MQIADKSDGAYRILEHLGSAHTDAELAALMSVGQEKLHPDQGVLPLDTGPPAATGERVAKSSRAGLLVDALTSVYRRLGFADALQDEAFFQLVLARLVEATSTSDSVRVLEELGVDAYHRNTLTNALARAHEHHYRSRIASLCFTHSVATTGVSLCLYDVTTLYFEAEHEDELRRVGYSKERRVDPQIVVGLLVDRSGFPLEIACYEGNKAETHTILPVIQQFQARHGISDMVIVGDAGMLSVENLKAIDAAGLRFIVGSRLTKAPIDLATHFRWNGDYAEDGHTVDTLTPRGVKKLDPQRTDRRAEPVWTPAEYPDAWRAVWQYRRKRALRDEQTLNLQRNRALEVIEGVKSQKNARFVKTTGAKKTFDEARYDQAMKMSGWKGYVSNIEADIMPALEVVGSYHELWHVEQSFRMSKTDLRARPIFHRKRDSIEAHLTMVFAALAVTRFMQQTTGASLKKIVTTLRPLREFIGVLGGHEIAFPPAVPADAANLIAELEQATRADPSW